MDPVGQDRSAFDFECPQIGSIKSFGRRKWTVRRTKRGKM